MNGHRFDGNTTGMYTNSFIEWVVFVYLRALSLNRTIDIVRATHEQDILSKRLLLTMIEQVTDALPTHEDITNLFHPHRSGHIAFDAVFFKYHHIGFGLLVAFDPKTFDLIQYRIAPSEDAPYWDAFIRTTKEYCVTAKINVIAVYSDGAKYLVPSVRRYFKKTPYQLCVVHKLIRMGQVVPVKSVHHSKIMMQSEKETILSFKHRVESVLFAETKHESITRMHELR